MAVTMPTEEDMRSAFKDHPEGRYTTDELLPVYNLWAVENRRPEIGAKTMGMALHHNTCLERGRDRTWGLSRRALGCRDWFVGEE